MPDDFASDALDARDIRALAMLLGIQLFDDEAIDDQTIEDECLLDEWPDEDRIK